MAGNIKGITIEFNGEDKGLKSVMRHLNEEARGLDKELRQIDKSLKFNPTNVQLWSQKQKVLTDEVNASKNRLESLKDAQRQLDAKEVDQNSEEYRSLEREIVKCENQLKGYKKELSSIPSARLKALSEGFKKVGDQMVKAGKTLTTKVTAPIGAAYTLAAKLGSDYEENLNKIDVAFGKSSDEVTAWANNAREQFGLSKVQATGAVSAFGALGKGIGLSEKDAASMSTTLAGLSADLGSYFNTSTDESAKALEGIFTGESEALKKFGVVMTDTNLKKFAEDQGLVYSELSQTEKTMLRYQYVLAKTGDAQGDFARTNDGTANSTKIFQAAIQDLGTAIGTQLLPIITPIIQKIADFISKIADLPEPVQKVITVVGLVIAVLGPLLLVIGSIASAIGSIMSLAPVIMGAIGGVASTLLPIIGIIAGVVAAGVLLYKNWDKIKEFAIKIKDKVVAAWDELKMRVLKTILDTKIQIQYTWNNIKTTITNIVTGIKTAITNAFTSAKNTVSNIFNTIRTIAVGAWTGIKYAITHPIDAAVSAVRIAISKIKGFFSNLSLKLPHIKLPHFKLTGKLSIAPPSVPKLSIDWYKNGGIFTNPTIFGGVGVGEAGAEAVLPLKKLWEEMDKRFSTPGVVINVNAPQGMDVNELAAEIERRIINAQNRRRNAWA